MLMERLTLKEEFDTNAVRFRESKTLIDRTIYIDLLNKILDEWNQGKTIEFEPVLPEYTD